MPTFAGRTFQRWAKKHTPPALPRRVAFFHGCGTNYYEPRLGEMTVALLEHNGIAVDVPKQDCCGLPLQSNGLFDDARGYVHRLAKRLAPYARDGVDIVGTSTSCTLMLKREALEILGMGDDEDAAGRSPGASSTSASTCSRCTTAGELKTDFAPVPETVVYHAPCQQQGHGIGKPALDLFALVPELQVVESTASCCGVAGTYGLKREKYDIAMQVGDPLFRQIAGDRPRPRGVRLRDVPLADRGRDRRAHRASGRGAPPRVRPRLSTAWSASSSSPTARRSPTGVVALAREMGGEEVAIAAAGGMDDGSIGTDAARVMAAVEEVRSPDGVLVLMDLGSALMSAEMATEMADPDGGPVLLCAAPLVEGAVAAAARARGGATLDEVAREARGALRMKTAQLGEEDDAPRPRPRRPAIDDGDALELRVTRRAAAGPARAAGGALRRRARRARRARGGLATRRARPARPTAAASPASRSWA